MKILLIIPPFTQLNSPYPSVTKLSGFLKTRGYDSECFDLSLVVFRALFSRDGLQRMFNSLVKIQEDEFSSRVYKLRDNYIRVSGDVIKFLDGSSPHLFRKILSEGYLPKGEAFTRETDLFRAFGDLGEYDKAKHFASLFIEDLTNFIKNNITQNFGLSRYAEHIATSTPEFSIILDEFNSDRNIVSELIREITLKKTELFKPDVVGFSIPFPGNLLGALHSANMIREHDPGIGIVFGGGYVNTELRKLNDTGIFRFTDFITLDEGELPLLNIMEYIKSGNSGPLVRTLVKEENSVKFVDNGFPKNLHFNDSAAPETAGINPEHYISLTELLNPMHRMWSDGYWNKLTLAHGCYWAKCTFCDVNLDYIGRYSPAKAVTVVNWMEELIKTSGKSSFHFTDEAAPPALLRDLSLEILRRKLSVTWWGNIRFEKAFSPDLCKLMAAAGCIAVSGGLEVADDRLLKLINKGVTVQQVALACNNFKNAGIMVHAYLMYGFPTQSPLETINSLEYVRQFMEEGLIDSGFWHLFTLTDHSPVATNPEKFEIEIISNRDNNFANNDLLHRDKRKLNHAKFSGGLKKAIYNYMNGVGLEWDVNRWFDFETPKTTIKQNCVKSFVDSDNRSKIIDQALGYWLGTEPTIIADGEKVLFEIHGNDVVGEYTFPRDTAFWIIQFANELLADKRLTYLDFLSRKPENINEKVLFTSQDWFDLREEFLLFL